MRERVLLLLPTTSYKAGAFMEAAERLDVQVIVGTDRRQSLEKRAPGHTVMLDFARVDSATAEISRLNGESPLAAVIGVDDETTILAAAAAEALGLRNNALEAVRTSRDKLRMRECFARAGMDGPAFRGIDLDGDPHGYASTVGYPCVLKPLFLSAGRGVIRVDDPESFVAAFRRIEAILGRPDVKKREGDATHLLVEEFMPGFEVALEALLDGGELEPLALFDKPDPLDGPVFEETLMITPSRLETRVQQAVIDEVRRGCIALGLDNGPVHAELRVDGARPRLLEIAPRTIGGLCSRTLRFGTGLSLEERVLAQALGRPAAEARRREAAGVMMIPVPRAGTLREVRGLERAQKIPGIESIALTVHRGTELVPLPEGHSYVGFIFARGEKVEEIEAALRQAHRCLEFTVED